jgi:serine/threonine protein phosphatase PrpC
MSDHDEDAPSPTAGRDTALEEARTPTAAAEEPQLVRLYTEKVSGHGEDSEPIAMEVGSSAWAVGVLDGLGGAGATPVKTGSGAFSSAYIASRIAREAVCAVLNELGSAWATQPLTGQANGWSYGDWLRDRLTERIHADLRRCLDEIGSVGGRVRGASIRPLPTTLALALARDSGGANTEIDALWAGDSRIYLLKPRTGLHQLSVDDLKYGGDAMRNLTDDGPMSNLLSADGNFIVNHCRFEVAAPMVLLAATDGCFGYLRTPAHFEELLLDSMLAVVPRPGARPATADPWRAWRTELKNRITQVAADDATMALACIGWSDFTTMTADFAERAGIVGAMVDAVDQPAEEHIRAAQALKLAEEEYERASSRLWSAYRADYESLLPARAPGPVRATATAPQAAQTAAEPARHNAPDGAPEPAGSARTGNDVAVRGEPSPSPAPHSRSRDAESGGIRPRPLTAAPDSSGTGSEESPAFPSDRAVSVESGYGADDLTALSGALTHGPANHKSDGGGR